MFNWNGIKKMTTLADLPLIEGYEEAVSSPEKYVLHHRAEIQPDGVHCSRQWLKEHHIYWNRPYWELIFMKDTEHRKMHMKDYHSSKFWKDSNVQRVESMISTKNSSSSKVKMSSRMREFWTKNHEKMHDAFCKRPSVYKDNYGMRREDIAKTLGITEWKVEQLHKKGELKCLL